MRVRRDLKAQQKYARQSKEGDMKGVAWTKSVSLSTSAELMWVSVCLLRQLVMLSSELWYFMQSGRDEREGRGGARV